jgi:hypothetical protein
MNSRREIKERFVAINCAAIPDNLLESELFGYEKGAFTGASKQTIGKIEYAHRGTLFLDEIGDLPMSLQAKLLRFLQERVIERLGGRGEIPVDVRVVAATHQNLAEQIKTGSSVKTCSIACPKFPSHSAAARTSGRQLAAGACVSRTHGANPGTQCARLFAGSPAGHRSASLARQCA